MSEISTVWHDTDNVELTLDEVANLMKGYVESGCKIYVGSDSMLTSKGCVFATVICVYGYHQKVSLYYYTKFKSKKSCYKNLRDKIMFEVDLSLQTAIKVKECFPHEYIEIHADVGSTSKSETRMFVDHVTGWIRGAGFGCKIKPKSWASSAVADWHTK